MNTFNKSFDLVLFDPPYSLRQLKEHYDGIGKDLKLWQTHNMWGEGKNKLAECVPVGGVVISLGWTTAGFGRKRGFEKRDTRFLNKLHEKTGIHFLLLLNKRCNLP